MINFENRKFYKNKTIFQNIGKSKKISKKYRENQENFKKTP